MKHSLSINLLLLITCWNTAYTDNNHSPNKINKQNNSNSSNYYLVVNKINTQAYALVNGEKVSFNLRIGRQIIPTAVQLKHKTWKTGKWFNAKNYIRFSKKARVDERIKEKSIYSYWIRNTDLTEKNAFKKVTKHWPLLNYCYSAGDMSMVYRFKKNGAVLISHVNGYLKRTDNFTGHVFRAGLLIEVRYPKPDYNKLSDTLIYNETRKSVQCIHCLEQDVFKCTKNDRKKVALE